MVVTGERVATCCCILSLEQAKSETASMAETPSRGVVPMPDPVQDAQEAPTAPTAPTAMTLEEIEAAWKDAEQTYTEAHGDLTKATQSHNLAKEKAHISAVKGVARGKALQAAFKAKNDAEVTCEAAAAEANTKSEHARVVREAYDVAVTKYATNETKLSEAKRVPENEDSDDAKLREQKIVTLTQFVKRDEILAQETGDAAEKAIPPAEEAVRKHDAAKKDVEDKTTAYTTAKDLLDSTSTRTKELEAKSMHATKAWEKAKAANDVAFQRVLDARTAKNAALKRVVEATAATDATEKRPSAGSGKGKERADEAKVDASSAEEEQESNDQCQSIGTWDAKTKKNTGNEGKRQGAAKTTTTTKTKAQMLSEIVGCLSKYQTTQTTDEWKKLDVTRLSKDEWEAALEMAEGETLGSVAAFKQARKQRGGAKTDNNIDNQTKVDSVVAELNKISSGVVKNKSQAEKARREVIRVMAIVAPYMQQINQGNVTIEKLDTDRATSKASLVEIYEMMEQMDGSPGADQVVSQLNPDARALYGQYRSTASKASQASQAPRASKASQAPKALKALKASTETDMSNEMEGERASTQTRRSGRGVLDLTGSDDEDDPKKSQLRRTPSTPRSVQEEQEIRSAVPLDDVHEDAGGMQVLAAVAVREQRKVGASSARKHQRSEDYVSDSENESTSGACVWKRRRLLPSDA